MTNKFSWMWIEDAFDLHSFIMNILFALLYIIDSIIKCVDI